MAVQTSFHMNGFNTLGVDTQIDRQTDRQTDRHMKNFDIKHLRTFKSFITKAYIIEYKAGLNKRINIVSIATYMCSLVISLCSHDIIKYY